MSLAWRRGEFCVDPSSRLSEVSYPISPSWPTSERVRAGGGGEQLRNGVPDSIDDGRTQTQHGRGLVRGWIPEMVPAVLGYARRL